MKSIFYIVLLLFSISFLQCSKSRQGDRRPSAFEQDILGKWNLANSRYAGYWDFKPTVIDSLSSSTRTVRQLDIHIPGFCASKGYWSLTNDSILDNSCIPMARIRKLRKDTLVFSFSSGMVEIEYKWHR